MDDEPSFKAAISRLANDLQCIRAEASLAGRGLF
jgi:hypothetical protein